MVTILITMHTYKAFYPFTADWVYQLILRSIENPTQPVPCWWQSVKLQNYLSLFFSKIYIVVNNDTLIIFYETMFRWESYFECDNFRVQTQNNITPLCSLHVSKTRRVSNIGIATFFFSLLLLFLSIQYMHCYSLAELINHSMSKNVFHFYWNSFHNCFN